MAWQQHRLSCCTLAGKGLRGTCPARAEGARRSPPHKIMRIGIRGIQAWLLQQVALLPSATVSRAALLPEELRGCALHGCIRWSAGLQQGALLPRATVSGAALLPGELQGCALHGCIRWSAGLQHADPSWRRAMALAPRPAAGRPVHARKRDRLPLQDDAYVAPLHGTRHAPQLNIPSGMHKALALGGSPSEYDSSAHCLSLC